MNPIEPWKLALIEQKRLCADLNGQLIRATELNSPRLKRGTQIAALRILHLAKLTIRAYWTAKPPKNSGIALPSHYEDAIKHKNLPILLTIYYFTQANRIPLDHWFRAQIDILSKMPHLWINCFAGQKAFERYADWDKRLSEKYIRSEDRQHEFIPASLKKAITKAILNGHRHALTWTPILKKIQPPTLSAALAYINSYLPAWYLVAHECFRRDVLEPGTLDPPALVKAWKHYQKSPWARTFCKDALEAAESQYGKLEWK